MAMIIIRSEFGYGHVGTYDKNAIVLTSLPPRVVIRLDDDDDDHGIGYDRNQGRSGRST